MTEREFSKKSRRPKVFLNRDRHLFSVTSTVLQLGVKVSAKLCSLITKEILTLYTSCEKLSP